MKRELDKAYDDLNVLPPTYEPAATGHVPEMLELIADLIERGHAYAAEDGSGDVYFDVRSWPSYGELTRQKVDDMEAAEDADPRGKRDPRDFALWKGHKAHEPKTASWPSPWGRGRPGWHIECSAMAGKYLGEAFDIHGGGVDLRFPHHENEQAQSRAAGHPFASYWMHNAWITTSGEKMSKSLGNSLLVPNVLERVRGIELRYYMVAAHYRSHVEFSFEALDEAAAGLPADRGVPGARRGRRRPGRAASSACRTPSSPPWTTTSAPRRRSRVIYDVVREGNSCSPTATPRTAGGNAAAVRAMLGVLGLDPADPHWATGGCGDDLSGVVDALVAGLLERRAEARANKDFAAADAIRDQIKAAGIEIEDTPERTEVDAVSTLAADQGRTLPGNSKRKGAIKKTGKGNPTAGSGGRVRRGLEGKGPTPKAKDRPYHKAHKKAVKDGAQPRRPRPSRPGARAATPSGSPDATPSSRRCAPSCRSPRCTSPRVPSATAGCARCSRSPPTRASRCSRCRASSSTG